VSQFFLDTDVSTTIMCLHTSVSGQNWDTYFRTEVVFWLLMSMLLLCSFFVHLNYLSFSTMNLHYLVDDSNHIVELVMTADMRLGDGYSYLFQNISFCF
jgi:hypothetical protein